jgi:CRP/FNR family transcriptional regulator, cyclic AMP receptor protein
MELEMIVLEDMKKMVVFQNLTDEMLERLLSMTEIRQYDEGEIIFRENDFADRFYLLRRGKILLEQRISPTATVSLGAIKAGYSFGWSAFFKGGAYTLDTICAEDCEVFCIDRENLLSVMEENPEIGRILYQNLARIIKLRLDHRTIQLLRVIKNHPDMHLLFKDDALTPKN